MKKGINRKFLLIACFISSVIYIGWRIFFTIPTSYGLVSFVAGLSLVIAEGIGVLESFSHYRNLSYINDIEKPEIPISEYPDVDILISTHSESTDLLYKTINGCNHMNYPDRNKVHIYVCDDNDRYEMKSLAEKMGVGYIGLSGNKTAKAGNLNNALSKTDSPLVVTFDADMIPMQDFLMETVPYFFLPFYKKDSDNNWIKREPEEIDKDYKIGFIQTPQSFYNPDLFQYNLFAEKHIPNEQDYFFQEVNIGRNRTNSAIYAGSNTIISREALEDVGGIRSDTITEDFATGIDIQREGYTCYAIPNVLAHGLAPDSFKSLIKQRQRWGRGCIQTLLKKEFLFTGLPFKAKLSYISCFLYWTTFARRFIYIISPILFTVFGIVVVETSLWELILIWFPSYVIYNRTLNILSGKIRNQKWSNIVDTILFPYMIIPIFAEMLGLKLNKFSVTPKEKVISKNNEMKYAIPHIMLVFATFVGLYFSINYSIANKSVGNIILIYWLIVNLYFLMMAIFFMLGRVNYRTEERFYAQVPVEIKVGDYIYNGITADISESGIGVFLENPEFIPYDSEIDISVLYLNYQAEFKGKVLHVAQVNNRWKYGIKILEIDEKNKEQYYQIIFDREHTLPKILDSDVIRDFTINISKRSETPIGSNRTLPRMPLNTNVYDMDGINIEIINFNYEYILISNNRMLKDYMEIELDDGLILKCKLVENRDNSRVALYYIQNYKEVCLDNRLRDFILKSPKRTLESLEVS